MPERVGPALPGEHVAEAGPARIRRPRGSTFRDPLRLRGGGAGGGTGPPDVVIRARSGATVLGRNAAPRDGGPGRVPPRLMPVVRRVVRRRGWGVRPRSVRYRGGHRGHRHGRRRVRARRRGSLHGSRHRERFRPGRRPPGGGGARGGRSGRGCRRGWRRAGGGSAHRRAELTELLLELLHPLERRRGSGGVRAPLGAASRGRGRYRRGGIRREGRHLGRNEARVRDVPLRGRGRRRGPLDAKHGGRR